MSEHTADHTPSEDQMNDSSDAAPDEHTEDAPTEAHTEDGPVTKSTRGQAKGKITRKVNIITDLMNKADIQDVEDAMEELDLVRNEFLEINRRYTESLVEAKDFTEAEHYYAVVEREVDEFKCRVEEWKTSRRAGGSKPSNETTEFANAKLEAARQKRQREEERLQMLVTAQEEERRIFEISRQAVEKEMELEQLRFETERSKLQARRKQLQERQRFEEEIRALREESQALEASMPPSDFPLQFAETDGHQVPVGSTPQRGAAQQKSHRQSWEPSAIEGDLPSRQLANLFTEAISEVLNQSQRSNRSVVDALQMPQGEIVKFSGDPMKYHTFIQAFRTSVDNRSVDSASKLNCLHRHLAGQAKTMIEYTSAMEPEDGYREALKVLEDRFGNRFRIGQAWIQKIMEHPQVKGHADMRELADLLQNCGQTMKAMKAETRLNNPQTLQSIWLKLPTYLQDRWTRADMKLQREQNRESVFDDMVEFITQAAEEADHPVYGRSVLSKEKVKEKFTKGGKSGPERRQTGSHAASAS